MPEMDVAPWRDFLWEELRNKNPDEVCPKASVEFHRDGYYTVVFMNSSYQVYIAEERVAGPEGDTLSSYPKFELVLLSYLVHAKDIALSGELISEKDLPGGSTFFRGPHRLEDAPLIERFGNNTIDFIKNGEKYNGKVLEYGDASFAFRVLPGISLACVLWIEDDEFPARIHFLFDSTTECHFALDVVYALVKSFTRKYLENCT